MSVTRYTVGPGGGFFPGVPGIWQGGEVIEHDDETNEVRVLSGPSEGVGPKDKDAEPTPPATKAKRPPASPAAGAGNEQRSPTADEPA